MVERFISSRNDTQPSTGGLANRVSGSSLPCGSEPFEKEISMSKKHLIGVAPMLAVAVFALMPTMASAATIYGTCVPGEPRAAECPEGEKAFVAFPELTPVNIKTEKTFNSGNFILKAAGGGVIECEGLINQGEVENVAGIGISYERLVFHHCFTIFETKKCKVNTAGSGVGVIVGLVTDEVIAGGLGVKITVVRGFAIRFSGVPAGCPAAGTAVGTVTGSATGTQARGSNDLVFSKTKGFKLGAEETEITGNVETYTDGGRPVVID
jgi:hypothetical protein